MKARHPGSFGSRNKAAMLEDIDGQESEEEGDGELELWKLLPQLRELPASMVRKLPMSAMFHLNAALSKEKKTTEKLGVNTQLAHNAKKVARSPALIAEARDNRRDLLHPARCGGHEQLTHRAVVGGQTGHWRGWSHCPGQLRPRRRRLRRLRDAKGVAGAS